MRTYRSDTFDSLTPDSRPAPGQAPFVVQNIYADSVELGEETAWAYADTEGTLVGTLTVAPGQLRNIHGLDFAESDSFFIEGLSGEIFITAHADVYSIDFL